ncbi:hypothetical protein AVDCRST_MAG82-442 [uncultured Rubrobacteraceae bacterium]|uniref:Uncharacterized protein n=1 Tax=uncultured Rubrobacteraceae bacterium TaxID=349277 RepID=A0A6J4P752_9ACTN|nr:hypothetical protein AVDCRST_MAG82-442 [uncultured Rubrobacteraceae bacterium]
MLVGAETLFWLLSGVFLVLRYWVGFDRASIVFLVLIVVDNLVILGLGVLDYLHTGEFATYQIAIAAVLLYGVTFGKRDFKRLDAYLKREITKRKNLVQSSSTPPHGALRKRGE